MIPSGACARRTDAHRLAEEHRRTLSELDAEWARRVAAAAERARAEGRGDVAEYLALRAANDLTRGVGCEWLLETARALAGEGVRAGASISVAVDDGHRFRVGNSTMVGRKLTLRAGVRELNVEAGWPRAPQDGIVRGGGLAYARVTHFGDRGRNAALLLVPHADAAPQWVILSETGSRTPLNEEHLRQHVMRLQQ
jgi:hypothetical protein